MTALPPDVVADLRQESVRLQAELRAARDRQAGSAEILRAIASTSGDAERSLQQIGETTARLFGASSVTLRIAKGDQWSRTINVGPSAKRISSEVSEAQLRIGARNLPGTVVLENRQIHIPDLDNVDPAIADWPGLPPARAEGTRVLAGTPLRRGGNAIGVLVVHRDRPEPFTVEELALQQSFADQAVIAIENARLFNETQEALARQTATAEILRVISQSPTDVRPVFDAIVLTAVRLLGCDMSFVMLCERAAFWVAAAATPEGRFDDLTLIKEPIDPGANFPSRAIVEKNALYLPDWSLIDLPEHERRIHETIGINSALYLPLLREGECIGLLTLGTKRADMFGESEIALAESFRDQALIAIENTRLFNETQEALERQTATSDILKVIASSPTDVQPVFEAIATNSNRLIGGFSTAVLRFAGDELHLAAFTPTNAAADDLLQASFPRPLAEFPLFMLVRDGETQEFTDTESENVPPLLRDLARLRGYRSMLFTPLMSNGAPIGMISVTRKEPGTFAAHHVQLVRTFADQAVIAIENVRLFDEVQAKTRDLTEALTYQTGSSNILSVIASSPTDVGPALKAIVESACELCEAADALVALKDGNELVFKAQHGSIPVVWERQPINRQWASGRAVIDRRPVHVHDLLSTEGEEFPDARGFARRANVRTVLSVPLSRESESIGAIVLRRTEVHPFSDKQIALLQTFANQAVIAIGNVELFDEVQAKTRDLSEALQQQTATADVLKVISRSAFDLDVVLNSLTKSAVELCNSTYGAISLYRDGVLVFMAQTGCTPEFAELLWSHPAQLDRKSVTGRTGLLRTVVQVADVVQDEDYDYHGGEIIGNYRSATGVPLLRNGELEGVFTLMRREPGNFTPRQVELVQTFADQAVIAIENVRLFDEVQARTKELAASLDELRTAQDRLVQTEKLASLGQLTAGIAHEIKNPLNFVNNFSTLSAELTDELNDLLKSVTFAGNIRQEVDELTSLLKDNLEKVVQHGKRADSIVKNMLLHSREGSGEHRPADINALLDESLNLAYHGARAEKPQFNVTLQRDFDDMAGMVELFPQEIIRVFLNLISNGFYAVARRKMENGGSGFEPILSAATRNLGNAVEIRIRDNGTGIPAEVKEKMFNPFFTTKPAGEGTGLGLSMSHDIIVKQHGGRIDVETEPGEFTEFRIVLPRTSSLSDKDRGQT